MTHPGVGPLTALAFVLVIGTAERFRSGKQIASYLGLVPSEDSSGERRRLGHISKQGNSLLRFLLLEAAQVTVRSNQEWRSKFFHLAMRRGRKALDGNDIVRDGDFSPATHLVPLSQVTVAGLSPRVNTQEHRVLAKRGSPRSCAKR